MDRRSSHQQRVQQVLAIFAGREQVASLGQLSPQDLTRLAWAIKHRLVLKERRPWPGPLVGTCLKTWYIRIAV